jgi:c-di-GMP-binding flagellar brake protein YcgR
MQRDRIAPSAFDVRAEPDAVEMLSRRRRLARRSEQLADAAVEVVDEHGQAIPYECFDLSAVGMYLHSDLLLTEGERLLLQITLPGSSRPVSVRGEVVRADIGDGLRRSGMGVAFRNLSDEARGELRKYVARRFARHAAAR